MSWGCGPVGEDKIVFGAGIALRNLTASNRIALLA